MGNLFHSLFPDDCRLCEKPLQLISRIPICADCLALPKPLAAEFACRLCRTPFLDEYALDGNEVCAVCREGQVNFDATYSFGSYEGPLRQLIHLFKYGKIESLAQPLGVMIVRALPLDARFDLVLPMPMHWRKQWSRGFNQAELLAGHVAARYGLKPEKHLRRSRYTRPQASLSETERQKNLKNSFCIHRPDQVWGKRVLLVDDVMTTGATLREAAGVLKAAGVKSVTALTLGRVGRVAANPDLSSLRALNRAIESHGKSSRVTAEAERISKTQ